MSTWFSVAEHVQEQPSFADVSWLIPVWHAPGAFAKSSCGIESRVVSLVHGGTRGVSRVQKWGKVAIPHLARGHRVGIPHMMGIMQSCPVMNQTAAGQ
jgi:hypothetical protein